MSRALAKASPEKSGTPAGTAKPAYQPKDVDYAYLRAAHEVLDSGGRLSIYGISQKAGRNHTTVYEFFQRKPERWDWLLTHLGVKPEDRISAYQRALGTGLKKSSIPHLEFCAKLAGWMPEQQQTPAGVNVTNNTLNLTPIVIQYETAPPVLDIPGNGNGHHD